MIQLTKEHNNLSLLDRYAKDVLVERAREVALEQLVVVDRLRHHPANKLVVAEVVGVAVGGRVDGVRHPVPGRRHEQGVHGVEDLTRHDEIPLSQQTTRVLPLLTYTHNHTG